MTPNRSGDRPKTAAELMAELAQDPEYVAMAKQRENERQRLAHQHLVAAEPLLSDLAAAGFPVGTVADLFNRKMNYQQAVPVLLSWLPRIADPGVKADVVRALAVPWAKPIAAPLLVQEFIRASDPSGYGLRWVIANSLAVVADDSVFLDIVRLVTDRRYGKAREMLALALANMKDPGAIQVLINLLSDNEVAGHAVMALGQMKAKCSRSAIEALLRHPKGWVREEARRALANMDSG